MNAKATSVVSTKGGVEIHHRRLGAFAPMLA